MTDKTETGEREVTDRLAGGAREPFYTPPKGMRCVWLSPDAKRCRRPAQIGIQFHGNPEWSSAWVIAYFCRQHEQEERES